MSIGYSKTVKYDIDIADSKVRDALQSQGFGIITEINVKDTFKKKLDVDFKPYRILGACNPKIAHEALQVNPEIGLLLPCNVVLWENNDKSTTVSAINAEKMLSLVDEDDLIDEAKHINSLLETAIDSL
ncbi:MAG: DUF302 domain-containing protein [Candidatus Marinimicrobia bacterium]|nr:DUF302 domain-containing protein [Candidatus Neomarinimicrobiota bacterium]